MLHQPHPNNSSPIEPQWKQGPFLKPSKCTEPDSQNTPKLQPAAPACRMKGSSVLSEMVAVPCLSLLKLKGAVVAGNICFPRLQLQPLQSGYRSATHDHDHPVHLPVPYACALCLCPGLLSSAPPQYRPQVPFHPRFIAFGHAS